MTATREPAADPGTSVHGSEALRLVGADVEVPLVTGGTRRYVNLDYAASAPALKAVHDAVEELLEWYSSVHRGAGFKSRASTAAYEGARESIRRFVNARDDDAVIITRNTTDSINLLAGTLPAWHARRRLLWRAPRQPAAVEADRRALPAGARVARRDARAARLDPRGAARLRGPAPRGRDRREQRDRRDLAAGRDRGDHASVTARGCSSTRPSWRRTRRSTCSAMGSTSWQCPATSCTRRTAPGR